MNLRLCACRASFWNLLLRCMRGLIWICIYWMNRFSGIRLLSNISTECSFRGIETRRRRETPPYPSLTRWRQVRFGNIAMKRKRGAQKCRRESRPADDARRRHIHCRGVEAGSLQHPIDAKRKGRTEVRPFLFGGGGGNRTRVRKAFDRTFSGCRAPTEFPRSCRRCAGCMIG